LSPHCPKHKTKMKTMYIGVTTNEKTGARCMKSTEFFLCEACNSVYRVSVKVV
jgi:hypothetical protein